jgi:hypothetical protein
MAWVPQESTAVQWDPVYVHRDPGVAFKLYVFLLLAGSVVAALSLFKVWCAVLPFNSRHPPAPLVYLKILQESSNRLKRWIGLIFVGSGLATLVGIYDVCSGMLAEKSTGLAVLLPMIKDLSATLSVGLLVVLLLYLARWHILIRIERLRE